VRQDVLSQGTNAVLDYLRGRCSDREAEAFESEREELRRRYSVIARARAESMRREERRRKEIEEEEIEARMGRRPGDRAWSASHGGATDRSRQRGVGRQHG